MSVKSADVILGADLDVAVQSSPFLTKEQMAKAMMLI